MTDVERIWRIRTESDSTLELRLLAGPAGDQRLVLEQSDGDPVTRSLDVEDARALALAMLEACEVAAALSEQLVAAG
jgi:hypothetical protein